MEIFPNQRNCGDSIIDENYFSQKNIGDILLIINEKKNIGKNKQEQIFSSSICQIHKITGRPVIANIEINSILLKTESQYYDKNFEMLLQELFHILAFSPILLKYYIDWSHGERYHQNSIFNEKEIFN